VTYKTDLGEISRNVWYDMVYHVKWSEGSDGFMQAWMNGKKVLDYSGPTLYYGISCYLKLADYHDANGQASSVIHDRIVRGSTAAAVSLTPLEGVQ
jgi:polysaccharide lyase-like protein